MTAHVELTQDDHAAVQGLHAKADCQAFTSCVMPDLRDARSIKKPME